MKSDKFYLKFQPLKWLSGKISFQSLELQGAFIQCCCVAFEKDNKFTVNDVDFRVTFANLEKLVMLGFVQQNEQTYSIEWIEEEISRISEVSLKRSKTGRLGGRPKAKESKRNQLVSKRKQMKANESIEEYSIEENSKDIYLIFIQKFNEVLGSKYTASNKKFRSNLDQLLKNGYKGNDAIQALRNAMKDPYHVETGYKYISPEFITRIDKLEKFLNYKPEKEKAQNKINVPNPYLDGIAQ